ncbi:MAG: hypothetical protein HXS47_06805 [Theionarchaea archaeon]|nr:hypothetical protein [Theionarchaea archaeon]
MNPEEDAVIPGKKGYYIQREKREEKEEKEKQRGEVRGKDREGTYIN